MENYAEKMGELAAHQKNTFHQVQEIKDLLQKHMEKQDTVELAQWKRIDHTGFEVGETQKVVGDHAERLEEIERDVRGAKGVVIGTGVVLTMLVALKEKLLRLFT